MIVNKNYIFHFLVLGEFKPKHTQQANGGTLGIIHSMQHFDAYLGLF
jgi:hypothetical protein